MLAALSLAAALVAAHPNSFSSSVVRVDGARVAIEVRCQARSLVEALPLDGDADGVLAREELAAGRDTVERYVRERYRVFASVDDAGATSALLELSLGDLELAPPLGAGDEPFVLATLSALAPEELDVLAVRCTLFVESNPLHRDTCTVIWNGGEEASWLFPEAGEVFRFVPDDRRRPGVFAAYVRLGVEHILTGFDHLAFVLALLLAAPRLRSIVGVVSAFTVAHTSTLALASLDLVRVDPRWVEMAIALSIAYVALLNLLQRRPSARWLEAFGFGLIHGLGFASSVADALLVERLKFTALVGFNLGVELGQLAVVVLAFWCLRSLPGERTADGERATDGATFIAPRGVRRVLAVAAILFGLYLFLERAGWLPGVA
ncbi:MAG: HupE/UreJ family protein [Planctomycetes bacterium]|nr:HupE/UreJ family protein [Planctomycetota bacterium]